MEVTIFTYDKQWTGAKIVGTGKDTFTGERDILIASHSDIEGNLDFYADPDAEGKHFNVGNNAFWLTKK